MQQKRKRTQQEKPAGEKPTAAKTRENATRAKTSLGTRLQSPQDHNSKPIPQQGQRQASYTKEPSPSSALEFRACALTGPDGQRRSGWELWVGGMMFGRADSQETLLAYHARLHDPLPSGHWKDRAWQPMKKKPVAKNTSEDQDPRFDDDGPEVEDPAWNE